MPAGNGRLAGLIVLDGWGLNPRREGNAVRLARTPVMDALLARHPSATLTTCGESVGLPDGQMGNSEVGHLNLGAGRIVYQDLTRIDKAVRDGDLARNSVLQAAFARAIRNGRALHFIGLLSPGGVHSHERHLHEMIRAAAAAQVPRVLVHAFLDGRDTAPRSAKPSLDATEKLLRSLGPHRIATVSGRYFAMDRDKRWPRTERAYRAMVDGEGLRTATPVEALDQAYERGEGDEFVTPTVIAPADRSPEGRIRSGDSVVAFNFRPDRMRQISRALCEPGFAEFPRPGAPLDLHYACMTEYDETFPYPVLFADEPLEGTIGAVVSEAGIRQFRIAETEKYAHVTYFFNGSEETPFPGEERLLVPSPSVATYDLKPEMSARGVTDALVDRLSGGTDGFFVVNFANADMVGHTGILAAAVQAVETVDECLGRVLEAVSRRGGLALVTADHGNAEQMIDEVTGGPHTAHTLNPVPVVVAGGDSHPIQDGILADVAPTLLDLLGLTPSPEMTGR
ncbi:MAG TPA: 2,3-bisphosphoglycerate-independent phosphoglycerate mutase, partial [Candidatus Eisenbacteria bacterium]|nr:2,3-bisphosphoglycerate-independent phosphoglycerate mutase [Candidatus Eisenbacteria bacterium]